MKRFASLCLLVILAFQTFAQTPSYYERTYWNYRDRFKKRFVKIGKDFGESLPAERWLPRHAIGGLGIYPGILESHGMYNAQGTIGKDMLVWSDNTSTYLSYYIAVLATEYKLV